MLRDSCAEPHGGAVSPTVRLGQNRGEEHCQCAVHLFLCKICLFIVKSFKECDLYINLFIYADVS